jgi:Fe-Mn family superoxide dismutase
MITSLYGSLEGLKKALTNSAMGVMGSGWTWLAYGSRDMGLPSLHIVSMPNQDPVSSIGLTPLLGIDVWEHAYYLQHENRRADYLSAIWDVINWHNASERLDKAMG